MYEAKRDRIEQLKTQFEREHRARSPDAKRVADEYLDALTDFIQAYNDGPAADPRTAGLDTTGQLRRVDEHAAWAEQERHRVRRALIDLA